jgi:uncharacterized membrane protein
VRTRTLRSVVGLAAGLGFIVSVFAAAEYFTASLRSACTINQFFSCGTVDRSGLTSTLGVPDYAWGIAGFVLLLIVAGIAEHRASDPRPTYALVGVSTLGVAFSADFLYTQLVRIHALCLVCASAEAFGVIVWICAIALAARAHRGEPVEPPAPASEASDGSP